MRALDDEIDINTGPLLVSLFAQMAQAIEVKYAALGGAAVLGVPSAKEPGLWTFAGSCICYDPDSGAAFELHGDIYQTWVRLGGDAFGTPVTDETTTPDGVGRFNHVSGGRSIYWTQATGAHGVIGAIRGAWSALGWERSALGYPVTDEMTAPDGVGRYTHFSGGGSIYWTSATGAHVVSGDIRNRWQEMAWEAGYLGYPVGDVVEFAEGGLACEFQNGGIYWWPDTGAIDLRDVVVRYTGLYAFGETDWDQGSDADEPYVIVSVATPQVTGTLVTQVYRDVDDGNSRPDVVEIYRGRPYGINISAVVMEHDDGDPNAYRQEVQATVDAVHAAGTLALGLIPVVGPFVAAVAGPALAQLMPRIGEALNDVLDTGDDLIGVGRLTWTAKQMVLLATRTPAQDFWGIGYQDQTGLVSGHGASYKAYFGVVPA